MLSVEQTSFLGERSARTWFPTSSLFSSTTYTHALRLLHAAPACCSACAHALPPTTPFAPHPLPFPLPALCLLHVPGSPRCAHYIRCWFCWFVGLFAAHGLAPVWRPASLVLVPGAGARWAIDRSLDTARRSVRVCGTCRQYARFAGVPYLQTAGLRFVPLALRAGVRLTVMRYGAVLTGQTRVFYPRAIAAAAARGGGAGGEQVQPLMPSCRSSTQAGGGACWHGALRTRCYHPLLAAATAARAPASSFRAAGGGTARLQRSCASPVIVPDLFSPSAVAAAAMLRGAGRCST